MVQGYQQGLLAAKRKPVYTINPYPEWCAEHKRFNAGLKGEPDPNRTPTKRRNLGAQG